MNLNQTMWYQAGVFFILALFTMKFVWPPLIGAIDARMKKIADGLAAADQGQAAMKEAEKKIQLELAGAREEGLKHVASAEKRGQLIVEEAKNAANAEAARIIAAAQAEAVNQVTGAEQILKREVNASAHADLLNQLKTEL